MAAPVAAPPARDPVDVPAPTAPAPAARALPLAYTVTVAVLAAAATVYGLLAGDAYRDVSQLTEATWRAQDTVTLAAAPLLVVAAWRARAGSLAAHVAWTGGMLWIVYCYAHLAVGAPFNAMFLVYVALLGMAGFALLDGLLRVDAAAVGAATSRAPRRVTAWFLVMAATGIAFLWLSDIVPALSGDLPTDIHLAELPNPTWVLDLAWLIPMSLGAAAMLWRGHPAAWLVAGPLLVALLLLSAAMLALLPFATAAGLHRELTIAIQLGVFTAVFGALGLFEAALLIMARRRLRPPDAWRRAGWWC